MEPMRCPRCGALVHYRTAAEAMGNIAGFLTGAAIVLLVTLLTIAAAATLVAYIGRAIT